MADQAVRSGRRGGRSYLVNGKISRPAAKTGAEAVHPGYGFLSEREAFRVHSRGRFVFIGPNAGAIAAMGDKIRTKKAAAKADVSTVPATLACHDEKHAVKIADGNRLSRDDQASAGRRRQGDADRAFDLGSANGLVCKGKQGSFGDDRVFIENSSSIPPHRDSGARRQAWHVIYLGSGMFDPAPQSEGNRGSASPLLDETTRRKNGEQAVALARP